MQKLTLTQKRADELKVGQTVVEANHSCSFSFDLIQFRVLGISVTKRATLIEVEELGELHYMPSELVWVVEQEDPK